MMPDSRKADDLRRDPRFAPARRARRRARRRRRQGQRPCDPGDRPGHVERFVAGLAQALPRAGMGLFRTELTDASLARVEDDWLVIDSGARAKDRCATGASSASHAAGRHGRPSRVDRTQTSKVCASPRLFLLVCACAGVGTSEAMAEPAVEHRCAPVVALALRRLVRSRAVLIDALLLFYKYGRLFVKGESGARRASRARESSASSETWASSPRSASSRRSSAPATPSSGSSTRTTSSRTSW